MMRMGYGLALLLTATMVSRAIALEPAEIWIIANQNVPKSKEVAEHYAKLRGVPKAQIILLDLPKGEDIAREDYEAKLAEPLRAALKDNKDKVKCLLTVYGVPLRVGREEPSADEKAELAKLKPTVDTLRAEIKQLRDTIADLEKQAKEDPDGGAAKELKEKQAELAALQPKLARWQSRQRHLQHAESEACVDSELSLLWWEKYELRRWQVNLLHFQTKAEERGKKPPILMAARLDGPSAAIAKRLVDDAVAVERAGLEGKVHVDARGIRFDPKKDSGHGYGGYDESLREMAALLKDAAKFDVTLDDKQDRFAEGACSDCALYCGWYALAKYEACCKFVKGAVAYHIASSEAVSLRNPKATYWCKGMLDDGVCATLGPVAEPYTVGFPKPAEFFGLLATGRYTLVECYYRTLYFNSWMTVLIGDPLYRPFAKNPRLKQGDVRPSPNGGRPLVGGN